MAVTAHGRVDVQAMIEYGLDDAEAARRAGRQEPIAVKVMIMDTQPEVTA
jgi:hypothetical protein